MPFSAATSSLAHFSKHRFNEMRPPADLVPVAEEIDLSNAAFQSDLRQIVSDTVLNNSPLAEVTFSFKKFVMGLRSLPEDGPQADDASTPDMSMLRSQPFSLAA